MKHIVFILVLSFSISIIYGQNSKVVSAYNYMKPQYNELEKAKENIDAAAEHEKTIVKAKTWYYRGQIYHAIFQSEEEKFKLLQGRYYDVTISNADGGTSQFSGLESNWTYSFQGKKNSHLYISGQANGNLNVHVKIFVDGKLFKESQSSGEFVIASIDGTLENDNLVKYWIGGEEPIINPLSVAVESYIKCMELDTKNQFKIDIISRLNTASIQFMNAGIDAFNDGEYKKAYNNFVNTLSINELPEFDKIDTLVMFNAAIAADRSKMFDEAMDYYKKVADLNYGGSNIYSYMANIHKEAGDTVVFLEIVKEGIAKYPDNNNSLMVELINYYLDSGKSKEALNYLTLAIENDPENQTYYFAKGTLHEQLEEVDSAIVSYKKAIELKADYFDALLNLGAVYYNKAGDIIKVANDNAKLTNKQYEAEKKKAYDQFKIALPYLEKSHTIDTTHIETMISLKEMYYRLQMMDKYDVIKAEINAAKNK